MTYINSQGVPDLFVATGSSHWGTDYKTYPWTIGLQPDYVSEGKIYAKDILKNHPNAKIGVLRQNDDYGKDYVTGLKAGLGDKANNMVIDEETYEANAADVSSQTAAVKAKGADLFYIVATPKFAVQAIVSRQPSSAGSRPSTSTMSRPRSSTSSTRSRRPAPTLPKASSAPPFSKTRRTRSSGATTPV